MIRTALVFVAFITAAASSANAGRMGPFNVYTIDGRFADPDRTSTLYRIDPDTGEVLETIGDTGLRLNAITMWPPTSSIIGVTSADDSQFPEHLVEIDPHTGVASILDALEISLTPIPPRQGSGDSTQLDFRDLAVVVDFRGQHQLALIRTVSGGDGLMQGAVLWRSVSLFPDGLPRGRVTLMSNDPQIVGIGPSGRFGLAEAEWNSAFQNVVTVGCTSDESVLRPPPVFLIDPPPPPAGADLTHPSCFSAALMIGWKTWLGVQTDFDESAPRNLIRIMLNGDQASLEDLGPLPDNTVGIAFGPAFPVEPVPALSRMALIVLLALVAAVVVLRRRARA